MPCQIFPMWYSRHWEPPCWYFQWCFLLNTWVHSFIRYSFISGCGKWSPGGEEAAKGHMNLRSCKAWWQMCLLSCEPPGLRDTEKETAALGVGSEEQLENQVSPAMLWGTQYCLLPARSLGLRFLSKGNISNLQVDWFPSFCNRHSSGSLKAKECLLSQTFIEGPPCAGGQKFPVMPGI